MLNGSDITCIHIPSLYMHVRYTPLAEYVYARVWLVFVSFNVHV